MNRSGCLRLHTRAAWCVGVLPPPATPNIMADAVGSSWSVMLRKRLALQPVRIEVRCYEGRAYALAWKARGAVIRAPA